MLACCVLFSPPSVNASLGGGFDNEREIQKFQEQTIVRLTGRLSDARLQVTRLEVERLERREHVERLELQAAGFRDREDEPDATAARVASHESPQGWTGYAFAVDAASLGDRANEPDATAAVLAVVVTLPELPARLPFNEKLLVRSLAPEMQWKAVDHYARLGLRGIRLQFNSGTRTPEEQAAIRARTEEAAAAGGALPSGLSGFAAKRSFHEVGLAYDGEPVPKNEASWVTYGVEAEALGLEWGGRWTKVVAGVRRTDRPHVQMRVPESRRAALASAFVLAGVIIAGAVSIRSKTG